MRARLAFALLVCLLAGCATEREARTPAPLSAPLNFPTAVYRDANARGEPVYRIDSENSQILMRVYRGGSLARFGHDHVIASREVNGYALWPKEMRDARADVYVAIDSFTVDEPALRARAGLETQPSQSDIEGTRRNMRKAIEADVYPFVILHLVAAAGEQSARLPLRADVTLHGVTRTVAVQAMLDTTNAGMFYVKGGFAVNQTDFGITPFSFLGGALQVQDKVDVEFELALTPLPR